MNHVTCERRTSRRVLSILATLGLLLATVVLTAPLADAAVSKCQAENLIQGTKESPNLQALLNTANPGDTIQIKGICVGTFSIAKSLTLTGKATKTVPHPTLDAHGSGSVLTLNGDASVFHVTLNGLSITGGNTSAPGGGIFNGGATLVLNDSSVHDNTAGQGGGIVNHIDLVGGTGRLPSLTLNDSSVNHNTATTNGGGILAVGGNGGTITMNGTSSVSGNTAGDDGGGILQSSAHADALVMNDSSSVSGNTAGGDGGGVYNFGLMTMNDSSSVSGNRASGFGFGGGIYNSHVFPGTVTLSGSSSVTGNTAFIHGGIFNDGTLDACTTWNGAISPNTPDDPPTPTLITC